MPTIMENGKLKNISVAEYNEYMASLRANLKLNEDGALKSDKVEDLDKIWVNGQEFSGMSYQGFLTVNTKTYVEEPSRANDGSIPNINDYDTFVVPRCKVNFKYFSIDDYRRMCDAVQSNEFVVKYFDKQFGDFVSHKMYCEPEEMVKLYNVGIDVIGVMDYEISFIGTLNDLDEHKVIYVANNGTIKGNPTLFNSLTTYHKDDRVYLEDVSDPQDISKRRYFQAIYYENSFIPKRDGYDTIQLTNTNYWKARNLYVYSDTTTFSKDNVAYETSYNNEGNAIGRNYYIAIYNGYFAGRPLTDTSYWQKISVSEYADTKKYSSNKTSITDSTLGQFVVQKDNISTIYEAIYYFDTFSGKDPTNTTYWALLPIGTGIEIKWGNSIVVASPEDLFDAPVGKSSNSWTTKPDGTGFTYYETQSLNVFKNLTLYAKWE